MKLLIVEDSRPTRKRLESLLAELPGLHIRAEATFRDGVAGLVEFQPDVVLLDIQLPDGSGLDLLGIVKRERPAATVLILSNHEFYRKRSLAEGADGFFDKTMEFDLMLKALRDLCGRG